MALVDNKAKIQALLDSINALPDAGSGGADGEDGGYYIPSVTQDGDLSWSATKADMPSVGTVNIRGPQGDTGPQGNPGENGGYYTPSVNASTGVLSWQASKSGMASVSSVNVKGPKGDTGATGATGYSPVRGTDYWTDSDKIEIVSSTVSALPTITLVATYVDGSSETFLLKGERL